MFTIKILSFNDISYYTYEIHGNVDTLLQDYNTGIMKSTKNRYKKIVYDYDLISGKVNIVSYQPGDNDAFYHKYAYDAENRLVDVETSRDKMVWDKDARYFYYKHGPLSRTILGQNQVQGLDYAYTLQGWLKGVNSTSVEDGSFDIGQDGKIGSGNSNIGRDAFGMSLNYFTGDYKTISNAVNSFAATSVANDLFNGNINSILINSPKLGDALTYSFKYDQLNRLIAMDAYKGLNTATNTFTPVTINDYKERLTYDANGNIKSYLRNGSGSSLNLNNYSYSYIAGSNKLQSITNAVNSQTKTYDYDEIGDTIKDEKQGITNGVWNVYGKLQSLTNKDGAKITYTYDASGQRISKQVGALQEWYVKDVSGNTMATYKKDASINNNHLIAAEFYKYGSSLLSIKNTTIDVEVLQPNGNIQTQTAGNGGYIITDQSGNTRVIVSDKKIQHSSDNITVDFYTADVKNANFYSAYGAISKTFGTNPVLAFNGQRKSTEISADAQTAEFWEYNGDVGRRWNVDPKLTTGISSYEAFLNNPIQYNDVKGDTIFRPAFMQHTFEDPLKMVLYKTPLGKQLLDEYSKSSKENIYFYAFDLKKESTNFKNDNDAIMNTVSELSVKNNVNKKGDMFIANWDAKAREGGEEQLHFLNSSGFNFKTNATINIIGLNTTNDQNIKYDKYDLAFVMYHEIYAHVKLASLKDARKEHRDFGNTYYAKGMGLYDNDIVGGTLVIQGSEAWKIFKQLLELKIKNGDGTEQNKIDLNSMNQTDQAATKAAKADKAKTKKE
ncbi:MAG: hypothetical protein ABI237_18530 [Ginsengibacter sp.]